MGVIDTYDYDDSISQQDHQVHTQDQNKVNGLKLWVARKPQENKFCHKRLIGLPHVNVFFHQREFCSSQTYMDLLKQCLKELSASLSGFLMDNMDLKLD